MEQDAIITTLLTQSGLTEDQSKVYFHLLNRGFGIASGIAKRTSLKPGLTYKVLDQLIELKLIEKKQNKGDIAQFFALSPKRLQEIVSEKEKSIKETQKLFDEYGGKLLSTFNLSFGKPNIQFYEGSDGINKVLDDILTSTDTVRMFSDVEAILKYLPSTNDDHVKKRLKRKIAKRIIDLDTPTAREYAKEPQTELTQTKLMTWDTQEFGSVIQIYDGKVAFINLKEESLIGIIIEDRYVYDIHKNIFDFLWSTLSWPDGNSFE